MPTNDDKLITPAMVTASELAKTTLRCSVAKVYRMVDADQIPHIRIGRSLRFIPADVIEALKPKRADVWAQRPRGRKRA